MDTALTHVIEDAWSPRLILLKRRVAEALADVNNLLLLEDHYRHGHSDEQRLGQSLGSFASDVIDFGSLSEVLGKSDEKRLMSEVRYERVRSLSAALEDTVSRLEASPPMPQVVSAASGKDEILRSFETASNAWAETFKMVRLAGLESKALYVPEEHDAFFEDFDWRNLDNEEAALCPPFVVTVEADNTNEELFSSVLNLVTSGRPVKVLLIRSRFEDIRQTVQEKGRAAALRCFFEIELLPFLLRKVFLLQYSLNAGSKFPEVFADGLFSPRPAILSVYAPRSGAENNGIDEMATRALYSRTFPHFVFDPDRTADFVTRLELLDNPANEKPWASVGLDYLDEDGKPVTLERPYTFADLAYVDGGFQSEFSPLAEEDSDRAVSLPEYLNFSPAERAGKVPFVYVTDASRRLTKLVPSREIVVYTAEKLQLWETLQELAGIKNPYVQAAKRRTEEELRAEQEKALQSLREELEAKAREREKEVLKGAMKNVALKLAGMGASAFEPPSATSVPKPEPVSAPSAAPAEEAPQEVSELPWIESRECTTCDDCITINKKIFGYNKDKKAEIIDPRGGPFKDIVKAAEKCPARIIHPGKPQDPHEKDLEKWVERAAKFQ